MEIKKNNVHRVWHAGCSIKKNHAECRTQDCRMQNTQRELRWQSNDCIEDGWLQCQNAKHRQHAMTCNGDGRLKRRTQRETPTCWDWLELKVQENDSLKTETRSLEPRWNDLKPCVLGLFHPLIWTRCLALKLMSLVDLVRVWSSLIDSTKNWVWKYQLLFPT